MMTVVAVRWDLGVQGLAILGLMAVGFGAIAHVAMPIFDRATPLSMSAVAAATYFVAGLSISEGWFGWATQAQLQPNLDGLSFDEVLLIGPIPGVLAVLAARFLTGSRHSRQQTP
jgi:hypothetical protein